jgi:hypothetical protein
VKLCIIMVKDGRSNYNRRDYYWRGSIECINTLIKVLYAKIQAAKSGMVLLSHLVLVTFYWVADMDFRQPTEVVR